MPVHDTVRPVTRTSESTRARLITAAEQLFAEHGVDVVSLREINLASGSRNAMALQYHFEDRTGVLRAILDKHEPSVDARRQAMLDQYEADGTPNLRALTGTLVRASASKLADSDGGPAYLQIVADLLNRPHPVVSPISAEDPRTSLHRWRALVTPLLAEDAVRLHRRWAAMLFTATELARRASTGPHRDDRLFVSHLIDLVTGLLAAPVSEETLRLAEDKEAAQTNGRKSRPRREP
jgi:AcrR family transcriptional regulator